MRYLTLISLILLCSCSSMKKSKSHVSTDSTTVSVHKENTVAKKKDSSQSGKSMITRNKKVKKEVKETAPVITWTKVDSAATSPDEHLTIFVKGGKLIGIKGTKVKETKEDKADSSTFVAVHETHVTEQADTASKSDSTATALKKETTDKKKDSTSFSWWWLLLVAIAGGCYWLFFTESGKRWKSNAIGWVVSKFV